MKKIVLAWAIISGFTSIAWAGETITVEKINEYLSTRNFKHSGPGPYLGYSNADQKISVEAHATAKKFKTDNAILDIAANAKEPIKQINFTATICNPWHSGGDIDLKPELLSLKDEKKKLLQTEVIEAAETLFGLDSLKDNIASIKDGEKFSTPAFILAYNEYLAKCDTSGGRSIYYKIFIRSE